MSRLKLITPNLKHLDLIGWWSVRTALQSISQSLARLDRLTLVDNARNPMGPADMLHLLGTTTSLKSLVLRDKWFSRPSIGEVMLLLLPSDRNTGLAECGHQAWNLPELECLSIHWASYAGPMDVQVLKAHLAELQSMRPNLVVNILSPIFHQKVEPVEAQSGWDPS